MGKPSSCNKNNNNNNVLAWKLVISNSHLRVEYVYIKYNQQRTKYKSENRHYHLIKYLHIILKSFLRVIYYENITTKLKVHIIVPTLGIIPYKVKTKFKFKETSFLSLPMVVMVPIYAHLHN